MMEVSEGTSRIEKTEHLLLHTEQPSGISKKVLYIVHVEGQWQYTGTQDIYGRTDVYYP